MVPFIIIGIVLVAWLGYMKFYYPKFKQKYEQNEQQVAEEWQQRKDEIVAEYFSNPDKFGLIAEATQGEQIIGLISGKIPKDLKSKLLSKFTDAITFTSKVDLAHYYLVATDQGLHYMAFDGEKCFINEVFDYNEVTDRSVNYFVREYFAFEPTHNMAFEQGRNVASMFTPNTEMMKVSPEKSRDFKVREYLVEQFKQKMQIR